jgi:hypothetical protein
LFQVVVYTMTLHFQPFTLRWHFIVGDYNDELFFAVSYNEDFINTNFEIIESFDPIA